MQTYWISTFALSLIHIGLSALFGAWIHGAKKHTPLKMIGAFSITAEILLIASIWATPLGTLSKILLFIISSLILLIVSLRFDDLSLQKDWMWLYAAFTMGLILIWSINQGQAILAFSMSLLASLACLLALIRGKQSRLE